MRDLSAVAANLSLALSLLNCLFKGFVASCDVIDAQTSKTKIAVKHFVALGGRDPLEPAVSLF